MCNKCNVYINYLSSNITTDIINEFNKRMEKSNGPFINEKNIDDYRSHPLLLKLSKKYNNNIKFEKVCHNHFIPTNQKLSQSDYIQLLIYLLDEWSQCECFTINNPIHILMNFKFVLKSMEELNLISSDLCYKLKKILRYKVHIKEQLDIVRITLIDAF